MDDFIAEIPANNIITNRDLDKLVENKWLNDVCINAIAHLASLLFPRDPNGVPLYHVMDTAFFTLLAGNDGQKTYAHESIKGFTTNKSLKYSPFACQKIFVPVNVGNYHWALYIIELFPPDRILIKIYDSNSIVQTVHENVIQWVQDEIKHSDAWSSERLRIEKQTMQLINRQQNDTDCGIYICGAIINIADGRSAELTGADTQKLRQRFASDIQKYKGDHIYRFLKQSYW